MDVLWDGVLDAYRRQTEGEDAGEVNVGAAAAWRDGTDVSRGMDVSALLDAYIDACQVEQAEYL